MPNRDGNRIQRNQRYQKRIKDIGNYLIITDTEATEKNYFQGLHSSFPKDVQRKLVIKVSKAGTDKLVEEALEKRSVLYNFADTWIVFDRDRVNNFDEIISSARKNDIGVGWSNPCFEIWFSAYFGSMPKYAGSVDCCKDFAHTFKSKTGQEYKKSDPDIYSKLCKYGNEEKAINIASQKYREQSKCHNSIPSEMNPSTTVHVLVQEITSKASKL